MSRKPMLPGHWSWPRGQNRRTLTVLALLIAIIFWVGLGMVPKSQMGMSSRENPFMSQAQAEKEEKFVQLMIEAPREPTTMSQVQQQLDPVVEEAEKRQAQAEPPASSKKMKGDSNARTANSPDIEGHFDVPVMDYVRAVQRRAGGKLVIWDIAGKQAIGEVIDGRFRQGVSLERFSTRARDLTEDLPTGFRRELVSQIGSRFGIWRFVLVVPLESESHFRDSVTGALAFAGLDWASVDLIKLRYGLSEGRVVAHIESASVQGRRVPVNQAAMLW